MSSHVNHSVYVSVCEKFQQQYFGYAFWRWIIPFGKTCNLSYFFCILSYKFRRMWKLSQSELVFAIPKVNFFLKENTLLVVLLRYWVTLLLVCLLSCRMDFTSNVVQTLSSLLNCYKMTQFQFRRLYILITNLCMVCTWFLQLS